MEAAVQLSFNKHCDRKQPKYWPVIPLKFWALGTGSPSHPLPFRYGVSISLVHFSGKEGSVLRYKHVHQSPSGPLMGWTEYVSRLEFCQQDVYCCQHEKFSLDVP
jgi:hypothetical protein